MQTQTVIGGFSLGADMPAKPDKVGLFWGGWYTERDGRGTWFDAETVVHGDMTVYTKWADVLQYIYGYI
jgi:hypothetical protein